MLRRRELTHRYTLLGLLSPMPSGSISVDDAPTMRVITLVRGASRRCAVALIGRRLRPRFFRGSDQPLTRLNRDRRGQRDGQSRGMVEQDIAIGGRRDRRFGEGKRA